MALKVVILAAGKGTRMRSNMPKVLQPLASKPLLQHVIDTAEKLSSDQIITVIGHGAEQVKSTVDGSNLVYTVQENQLGTGHAVVQANDFFNQDDTVLILYGDVPLTSVETLRDLLTLVDANNPIALLTINLDDSTGYGRIVRNTHNLIEAIVEQKDALPSQLLIKEVNTGIMAVNGGQLTTWLENLDDSNAQGEFYLTDIIEMAVQDGFCVQSTHPSDEIEVLGVNDKIQLQALERRYQLKLANDLMVSGVTLIDASRLDIRGSLSAAQDVVIDVNTVFEGTVILGENVRIGANCILKNVTIANNTTIEPFSHLEDCVVGESCSIGPYARLRPGTNLASNVKVGNFVETKKVNIGVGSKISHLSYIGDTTMGADVNIGAGTITCNYDGVNKFQTVIGDNVFVGSDSQLVAPVNIGNGATIGAGSTITKDSPENELTLSRSKQMTVKGWVKPVKK